MTKKVIKTGLFGRVLRQAYKDKGISLPTNETIVLQKIQRTLLEKPVTQQAQKKTAPPKITHNISFSA